MSMAASLVALMVLPASALPAGYFHLRGINIWGVPIARDAVLVEAGGDLQLTATLPMK
jgi:hypothetical protein